MFQLSPNTVTFSFLETLQHELVCGCLPLYCSSSITVGIGLFGCRTIILLTSIFVQLRMFCKLVAFLVSNWNGIKQVQKKSKVVYLREAKAALT
jgi:hypothetical protein